MTGAKELKFLAGVSRLCLLGAFYCPLGNLLFRKLSVGSSQSLHILNVQVVQNTHGNFFYNYSKKTAQRTQGPGDWPSNVHVQIRWGTWQPIPSFPGARCLINLLPSILGADTPPLKSLHQQSPGKSIKKGASYSWYFSGERLMQRMVGIGWTSDRTEPGRVQDSVSMLE